MNAGISGLAWGTLNGIFASKVVAESFNKILNSKDKKTAQTINNIINEPEKVNADDVDVVKNIVDNPEAFGLNKNEAKEISEVLEVDSKVKAIRGDNFVMYENSQAPYQYAKQSFQAQKWINDLSGVLSDEWTTNLKSLAIKHPEMFQSEADVFRVIKEIKDNPSHFFKNNKDENALITKVLDDDKLGKLGIRKDDGRIVHATKVDMKDFNRLQKQNKPLAEATNSTLQSDKNIAEPSLVQNAHSTADDMLTGTPLPATTISDTPNVAGDLLQHSNDIIPHPNENINLTKVKDGQKVTFHKAKSSTTMKPEYESIGGVKQSTNGGFEYIVVKEQDGFKAYTTSGEMLGKQSSLKALSQHINGLDEKLGADFLKDYDRYRMLKQQSHYKQGGQDIKELQELENKIKGYRQIQSHVNMAGERPTYKEYLQKYNMDKNLDRLNELREHPRFKELISDEVYKNTIEPNKLTKENLDELEIELTKMNDINYKPTPRTNITEKATNPIPQPKATKTNTQIYAKGGDNLMAGLIASVDKDENGNISFNPTKFALGLAGYTGAKGLVTNKKVQEMAKSGVGSLVHKAHLQTLNEPKYINGMQKEQRGIYNVTFNDKKATYIKQDLDNIDNAIKYEKGNRSFGAKHINIRHLLDETKEGFVTKGELLNIGNNMRKYLNDFKEPYIDQKGARLYEWQDNNGDRFRVVVDNKNRRNDTASELPQPAVNDEIITFYSDRNLKNKMQFENPEVSKFYLPTIRRDVATAKPNENSMSLKNNSQEQIVGRTSKKGFTDSAVTNNIVGAGTGAMIGASVNEDDRLAGAIVGAGVGIGVANAKGLVNLFKNAINKGDENAISKLSNDERVKEVLTKATGDIANKTFDEIAQGWTIKGAWDEVRAKLFNTLGDEYNAIRKQSKIRSAEQEVKASRLAEALKTLTPETREALHNALVDEGEAPAGFEALVNNIRDTITSLNKEMVEGGILSQEAFDLWSGAYLTRQYQKYSAKSLKGFAKSAFTIDKIEARGKKKIISQVFF